MSNFVGLGVVAWLIKMVKQMSLLGEDYFLACMIRHIILEHNVFSPGGVTFLSTLLNWLANSNRSIGLLFFDNEIHLIGLQLTFLSNTARKGRLGYIWRRYKEVTMSSRVMFKEIAPKLNRCRSDASVKQHQPNGIGINGIIGIQI